MPAAAAPDAPAAAEIAAGLTAAQRQQFADDGYCVVEAAFSPAECDALIERQTALREGAIEPPAGWEPRQPDEWGRSTNQHVGDHGYSASARASPFASTHTKRSLKGE